MTTDERAGTGPSTTEPPPADGSTRRTRTATVQRLFVVGVVLLAVFVIAALLIPRGGGDDDGTVIPLSQLDTDVTLRHVGEVPVFVVRVDDGYRVLVNDARHLPDERLWWCPRERLFISPAHGEQFDEHGLFVGGPAPGGMNELASRVEGDRLIVDPDTVIVGTLEPRGAYPSEIRALQGLDWHREWDSGPGSVCQGAVKH